MNKQRKMYCIVKSAAVRYEPMTDSMLLRRLKFGNVVYIEPIPERRNRRIQVFWQMNVNRHLVDMSGWVLREALAMNPVEYMCKLWHINVSGDAIPASKKYFGEPDAWIEPGERIEVIARCGEMMLTTKGWTYGKWLRKDRDIDMTGVSRLMEAIIKSARDEYIDAVHAIVSQKYRSAESYLAYVQQIDNVLNWIGDPDHMMVKDMNRELGIPPGWLKKIHHRADLIRRNGNRWML